MLCIKRRVNQGIKIGPYGEISILIIEIDGEGARLGITAPDEIAVHRDEVFEEIQRQHPGEPVLPTHKKKREQS